MPRAGGRRVGRQRAAPGSVCRATEACLGTAAVSLGREPGLCGLRVFLEVDGNRPG